jgi:hypothetical protein
MSNTFGPHANKSLRINPLGAAKAARAGSAAWCWASSSARVRCCQAAAVRVHALLAMLTPVATRRHFPLAPATVLVVSEQGYGEFKRLKPGRRAWLAGR